MKPCIHFDTMDGDPICLRESNKTPSHVGICLPHWMSGSYQYCPYYQEAVE